MELLKLCGILTILVSVSSGQLTSIEQFIGRIEALERQGLKQRDEYQEMEQRLETKIKQLQAHHDEKENECRSQLQKLEDQFYQQHRDYVDKDNAIEHLETKLTEDFVRHRRLILDPVPVAFHALLGGYEHQYIGYGQKIKFDIVQANLGGGYHSQNGTFVAPQSGLYAFSVTILSTKISHTTFGVSLMKNDVSMGNLHGHSTEGEEYHDQSSITAVAQLNTNDVVWVQCYFHDMYVWGDGFSAFTGAFLYQA